MNTGRSAPIAVTDILRSIDKKCDICGKLYEIYDKHSNKEKFNALILINVDENEKFWSHDHIDLCRECRDAVKKVFKERSSHI